MPTPLQIARARVAAREKTGTPSALEQRSAPAIRVPGSRLSWKEIWDNGLKEGGRKYGRLLVADALRVEQGQPSMFDFGARKHGHGDYAGPVHPYDPEQLPWRVKARAKRAARPPARDPWEPYVPEEADDGDDQVSVVSVDRSALASVWEEKTERVYGARHARKPTPPPGERRPGRSKGH